MMLLTSGNDESQGGVEWNQLVHVLDLTDFFVCIAVKWALIRNIDVAHYCMTYFIKST